MGEAYTPDWASLNKRSCPSWFSEAKFGIFIHWGVYSVPAWAPKRSEVESTGEAFAEWYGWHVRQPETPFAKFHRRVYGESHAYRDFGPWFRAQLYDPDEWVDLFARAGARYAVLTAKHHDGYCLYPSAYSPGWNSVDMGPQRDLAGDFARAVRARGLRLGFYYSLMEWDHPLLQTEPERYGVEHMVPQMKELVEKYSPDLIYADGEWDQPSEVWHSCDFLSWLFNESAVRSEVVVNDRWGKETRSLHGGFFTTEYGEVGFGRERTEGRPWEEVRGIGGSFGYNRNEDLGDYLTGGALIRLLTDTVLEGGNLCLNVGPSADGKITPLMQERLLEIGAWLKVNGEAVYGTRPWEPPVDEEHVRYTQRDGALYAYFSSWPRSEALVHIPANWKDPITAQFLGDHVPLPCHRDGEHVRVDTRGLPQRGIPCKYLFVLKLQHG